MSSAAAAFRPPRAKLMQAATPARPAMNILMTTDTVGGVWTYALELATALQEYDVKIALATMGRALTPDQRRQLAQIPHVKLWESNYKLEWMDRPWQDVREAGEWLLAVAREVEPTLVHLNGYVHAALPWPCPILVVAHSCVLSWFEAVHGAAAGPEWDRYRLLVTRGLRAADMVIAPSQAMLAAVRRHYGFLSCTGVIPNGRSPEAYRPLYKEPFVLSAGRFWDEAKNLAALDLVAPALDWPVLVAGATRAPQGGRASPRNVLLLGCLSSEELADYFSRAAIYALPARYAPFGLSALEAGLAGCALVLGDLPSLREVWGDAAVFVAPEDHEALQVAINTLIAQPQLCRELGSRARTCALQYTPQRMARGYMLAYADLLPSRRQKESPPAVDRAGQIRNERPLTVQNA